MKNTNGLIPPQTDNTNPPRKIITIHYPHCADNSIASQSKKKKEREKRKGYPVIHFFPIDPVKSKEKKNGRRKTIHR